jgi:hypothetical protein
MRTTPLRLLLLLVALTANAQTAGRLSDLRCELRPSEHGGAWFSPERASHLHFLLMSNRDGVKVYQDWNSWGYYARSFRAKDEHSKIYAMTRRAGEWDKNYPATDILNKGDYVITDTYLCDGTWRASPKLPVGRPLPVSPSLGPTLTLQLTGRFTMEPDRKATVRDVWSGEIESAPVEVYLDKPCIDLLNSERGR